jgi:hypothetical protein
MEYLGTDSDDATRVSPEEVGRKIKAWWKDKSMRDDEWRAWAESVIVKWQPVNAETAE